MRTHTIYVSHITDMNNSHAPAYTIYSIHTKPVLSPLQRKETYTWVQTHTYINFLSFTPTHTNTHSLFTAVQSCLLLMNESCFVAGIFRFQTEASRPRVDLSHSLLRTEPHTHTHTNSVLLAVIHFYDMICLTLKHSWLSNWTIGHLCSTLSITMHLTDYSEC